MKFEIGEIAIYSGNGISIPVNAEVEIISDIYTYRGMLGHDIIDPSTPCPYRDSGKGEWFCAVENLRKKKPPEEASWDQIQQSIGWNPTKESELTP